MCLRSALKLLHRTVCVYVCVCVCVCVCIYMGCMYGKVVFGSCRCLFVCLFVCLFICVFVCRCATVSQCGHAEIHSRDSRVMLLKGDGCDTLKRSCI